MLWIWLLNAVVAPVECFVHNRPMSSFPIHAEASNLKRTVSLQLSSMMMIDDDQGFGARGKSTKFDKMKAFEKRLDKLEKSAPSSLAGYFEPHLQSFSVRPGTAQRFSVTSTCFALQAIYSSGDASLYDSVANLAIASPVIGVPEMGSGQKIQMTNVVKALIMADWSEEDLFQVPLVLHTVLSIDRNREILGQRTMDESMSVKVRTLVSSLLSARPMRRFGQNQLYSDYIMFQGAQAMADLQDATTKPTPPDSSDGEGSDDEGSDTNINGIGIGGIPEKALPDGAASVLSLGLARYVEVSYNELCRQLAYRSAGDASSFDVLRLAYSLLTYITASRALQGTAGREIVRGQGPDIGTIIGPSNQKLIAAALTAFFAEQNQEGLWDKGQPIYKSFRKSGRNVGNAFVFATDTLASLLESLPAENFRPHMDALQKTLNWIESHQSVEVIADYCDTESGQCYGKTLRGWTSPHFNPETGPQAWSTAQTLKCVSNMRKVITELLHEDVLAEFGGISQSTMGPSNTSWDRLLDTDLGRTGTNSRTLKSVLDERILTPFENGGLSNPSYGVAYSAVLFGPPGTAKTTICEALAERLGWDFLVIDTSQFLADGLTNVASRIRYVFERLRSLERCVILFDEIEEFCLDRETPGLGMESRMLTTAMLTAINDLRREKRCIFFLATNRLRAFDSAIIRPGRFDLQFFVGTPNLEARCIQLRNKLATLPVSEEERQEVEVTFRTFLESVWTDDAMFMNYLEGIQFASACANVVASGSKLTNEQMAQILQTQAAVMTVRGSVRDEYLASMELSRL
eukprot:scaffold27876_cov51-Attheya_sp.AAC.5